MCFARRPHELSPRDLFPGPNGIAARWERGRKHGDSRCKSPDRLAAGQGNGARGQAPGRRRVCFAEHPHGLSPRDLFPGPIGIAARWDPERKHGDSRCKSPDRLAAGQGNGARGQAPGRRRVCFAEHPHGLSPRDLFPGPIGIAARWDPERKHGDSRCKSPDRLAAGQGNGSRGQAPGRRRVCFARRPHELSPRDLFPGSNGAAARWDRKRKHGDSRCKSPGRLAA